MALGDLALPAIDQELEDRVQTRLEQVEQRLSEVVTSNTSGFITEAARHLMDAGGKRFRPLLVALAAEFGDPYAEDVLRTAVVVELTHQATLYHDDVMDEAALRRGAPSANARWDNTVAILTGDLLFARASDIMTDLGLEASRIQARTFARLVEGQLREWIGPGPGEDGLTHYLSVLEDKTGSLIATSARLGARAAGTTPEHEEVLTRFGEKIGIAFQLSDDVLDIASDSEQTGKTPGTDLREGVPTLPVLLAARSTDPADTRLRELLAGSLIEDAAHAEALTLLRTHPAMAEARVVVQSWADDARTALQGLPDIPARAALSALCDLVVTRTG